MIPSFTFNVLTIKGPRHELEQFRQAAGGFDVSIYVNYYKFNDMCFNNFIPLTEQDRRDAFTMEKACLDKWGASDNAAGVVLKEKPNELRYSFTTPTSMPRKIVEAMLAKFPNLKFDLDFRNDRLGLKGNMRVYRGKPVFSKVDKFGKMEEL